MARAALTVVRHPGEGLTRRRGLERGNVAEVRAELVRRLAGLMLKSKIEAMSYVGGVNVFDAEGNLINASAGWPMPTVNVADRPYFRTFRSSPQSPEMLVEPVYSRITGAWTTVIARKITGPKGEFLGAIGRGIEPVNFEKFFATVALGPGATIAMHHSDGTLLARYPHVAEMVGKNFKTGPAVQRQIFELPRSTSRLTSPIDGQDRLISSRALTNFPIVIVASTTTSAALADWREQIGHPDRDRRTFRAGDCRPAVSRRPQAFASAPRVEAAAVAGEAAPRHRRQQHDARPACCSMRSSISSSATSGISRCTASRPKS